MTQRKRTPHAGQPGVRPGKGRSAPTDPPSRTRIAGRLDPELDDPLLDLPPTPIREKQRTLTDPQELEAARRISELATFPPERVTLPGDPRLAMGDAEPHHDPDDEPADTPTAPPPPAAVAAVERERSGDPLVEMRDRYSLGDYTGALGLAERVIAENPMNAEALACAESCRDVLVKMYSARIGPLDRVPVVVVARNQLRWLSLDHRAGFVLSHIDGVSSLEMILDVSGMAPLDCLRILYELVQQRVISFR
jgi:hypothetical protein